MSKYLVCTVSDEEYVFGTIDDDQFGDEKYIADMVDHHITRNGEYHREHIVIMDDDCYTVIPGGPAAWKADQFAERIKA